MFSRDQMVFLRMLQQASDNLKLPVYLVGGLVRDLLRGDRLSDRDLDSMVEGNAQLLAKELVEKIGGKLKVFPDFLTAKIVDPDKLPSIHELDFASARSEKYQQPGSLPVVAEASLREDLGRRDFSVNAMALAVADLNCWLQSSVGEKQLLREAVVDLHGGIQDLDRDLIRVLHSGSFLDDPTRIFRACRYAVKISAEIEAETARLLTAAVSDGALDTVSAFRKLTEIKKICLEREPQAILQALLKFGVFDVYKLFDTRQAPQVLQAIGRLAEINLVRTGEYFFQVALRVFYFFRSSAVDSIFERGDLFSRRQMRRFEKELELLAEQYNAADLSPETLAFALATETNPVSAERLRKELAGRKLCRFNN